MPLTEKQKKAKRKRYKNATAAQKSNYAKYQKDNYKNIAASFARAEALYIADIYKAHGIKPAEVIRGAAAALLDGQPIRTEREPLTIPPEYQTPTDSEAETDTADTM